MEKRILGRTALSVSVLGFGAAEIGLQRLDRKAAGILLDAVLDRGINVIDTAECYEDSEELIGACLGKRPRDLFIFTKCGHDVDPARNWKPATIREGLERSLRRLKRESVDLLQLHSCPIELLRQGDVIELLERFKEEGKTRYVGCSADGRAAAYAISTGRFDVLQTSFSIADQEMLDMNLPSARAQDMGIIVKRPIANAVWRHAKRPDDPWLHAYWDRLSELRYPFLESDPSQIAETALRFVLTPPEVGTVIVGTTNPEHLSDNVGVAAKGGLDEATFTAIRERWRACGGAAWPGRG